MPKAASVSRSPGLLRRMAGLLAGCTALAGAPDIVPPPTTPSVPRAVISEFLADNASGLRDEDGDTSDWIEISNPGIDPIDLAGWRLTDRADSPGRWRFPAGVILPGGGRLVVFASGKDRTVAGRPLHAGFRLDAGGEYLALFPPAGTVPATAFAPAFPPQRPDVSFGTGLEEDPSVRVEDSRPARLGLGPAGDAGATWTGSSEPFDDSAWSLATAAIGYDDLSRDPGETLLAWWTFDDVSLGRTALDSSGRSAHGTLVGPAGFTASGGGRSGRPGDRALDLGSGGIGSSMHVEAAARGAFDLLQARDRVTISLWTFGGTRLPVAHNLFWFDSGEVGGDSRNLLVHLPWSDRMIYFDTAGCCSADTRISRQEPDPSRWRGQWNHYVFLKDGPRKEIWQNGVLWHDGDRAAPLKAVRSLWVGSGVEGAGSYPGRIDDMAVWAGALNGTDIRALAGGLPANAVGSYRPWIRSDLTGSMRGSTDRARLRIAFNLPDGPLPDWLRLDLRHDDGFRAWINGREVARDNAPVMRTRTKAEGRQAATWQWSDVASLLRPGRNILALEGFNDRAAGPDFLLQAGLRMGRQRDGRFFTTPSPGKPNDRGVAGFTAEPSFSRNRGFQTEPFRLRLASVTPGARLQYTVDGSAPSPTHGTRVEPDPVTGLASGEILVAASGPVRAMAWTDDQEPSPVTTHTYLFADQVARQPVQPTGYPATWGVYGAYGPTPGQPVPADYEMDPDIVRNTLPGYGIAEALRALPSVCITTGVDGLFDPATGIYANSPRQGSLWVRPASVEWIEPGDPAASAPPGGTATAQPTGFQVDAGLRIHGGLSREHWHARKHSFRVGFSSAWGPTRLRFRPFDDTRVTSADELTLRASSTDGWSVEDSGLWTRRKATYLRDVWMKDTQQALGWPCGHSRFVHLFLNGLYWGQYNLAERTGAAWLAETLGGDPGDYDIIKDGGEVEGGDRRAWDAMIAQASAGLASDAAYWRLQGRRTDGARDPSLPILLEVDSLIDYMILHIYAGATDWPNHNWWSARCRDGTRGGFRFFTWDQEISNLSLTETKTYTGEAFEAVSGPRDSPAFLYAKLRENPRFRARFATRVAGLTRGFGLLTPAQNAARWERRQAEIDRSIVAESARWGDSRQAVPLRRSDWVTEMAWMRNTYWPRIHAIALARFRRVGLETPQPPPEVTIDPPGGPVPAGTRVALGGGPDLFYTTDGTDPLTPGGVPTASALPYTGPFPLAGPLRVRAQRRLGLGASPAAEALLLPPDSIAPETDLELAEIHYHPSANDAGAFVEIGHRGGTRWAVLGGARVSGDIDAVAPNGATLAPGERAVFVADPEAFRARYGPGPRVLGRFDGQLDQGGGRVHLLGPSGKVLARVAYDDAPPWPSGADGRGPSLTLRASTGGRDPSDPAQWRPSTQVGGTPGTTDTLAFEGSPGVDADGDGWTALEEYLLGTRDTDRSDRPTLSPPTFGQGADGPLGLSLSSPLTADAVDVGWERSADLLHWEPLPPGTQSGPPVFGTMRETRRWTIPPSGSGTGAFFRLRLNLR